MLTIFESIYLCAKKLYLSRFKVTYELFKKDKKNWYIHKHDVILNNLLGLIWYTTKEKQNEKKKNNDV